MKFNVTPGLSVLASYQYLQGKGGGRNYFHEDTYYVRNLVNRFTQKSGSTIIPHNAILDGARNTDRTSHSARLQVNMDRDFEEYHRVAALAGAEIRHLVVKGTPGFRVWLVTYLLGLNFALVFFPYSIQFTKTGATRQRGYLEHLLCMDGRGIPKRVSLKEEVAYMHSRGDVREVFMKTASSAPLTITQSLIALDELVDPQEFFLLNRNYLVHWSAIARWEDEENGRRVKVWLKPPVYLPGRDGEEETFEYVSKEKAALFKAWYANCLSRHTAA